MSIGCGIACGLFRARMIGPESKSMFFMLLVCHGFLHFALGQARATGSRVLGPSPIRIGVIMNVFPKGVHTGRFFRRFDTSLPMPPCGTPAE